MIRVRPLVGPAAYRRRDDESRCRGQVRSSPGVSSFYAIRALTPFFNITRAGAAPVATAMSATPFTPGFAMPGSAPLPPVSGV